MTTLEKLTVEELKQKLSDPGIQDSIDFDIEMILSENSSGSALKAIKKLEPVVKPGILPGDLVIKYQALLNQIKLIALPKLKQDEITELLSTQFLLAISNGYDLGARIHQLFDFSDANDFRKVDWLLRSMEANNELLISNVTFPDGRQFAGTIGNLLRLYKNSTYFQSGGSLGIGGFLVNERNLKNADAQSKENLRYILSIYDWIRLKALSNDSIGSNFELANLPTSSPPLTNVSKIRPTTKDKELTNFEKKLAEVSATHSSDLDVLKRKLEQTAGPGPTGPVVEEVKKEVQIAKKEPVRKIVENKAWTAELNREVKTKELPQVKEELLPAPKKIVDAVPMMEIKPVVKEQPKPPVKSARPTPRPIPEPKPMAEEIRPAVISTGLASIADVHNLEDLKRIEVGHLRQGPTQNQVDMIKQKIDEIIQTEKVMRYYAVLAFEQSPLFKAYLNVGSARVAGVENGDLGPDEFEAMADLRKRIEQL